MKCNCSCCSFTTGTTFRSDAGIQGWLVSGPGDITLWREGASISLVRGEHKPASAAGKILLIYLYFLSLFPSKCSLPASIKSSVGFLKVPYRIKNKLKEKTASDEMLNSIRAFPVKEGRLHGCSVLCVCVECRLLFLESSVGL